MTWYVTIMTSVIIVYQSLILKFYSPKDYTYQKLIRGVLCYYFLFRFHTYDFINKNATNQLTYPIKLHWRKDQSPI